MQFIYIIFAISVLQGNCSGSSKVRENEGQQSAAHTQHLKDTVTSRTAKNKLAEKNMQISNAKAYYSISTGGAQMVDNQGNPVRNVQVNRFLLLELPGNDKPIIQSVAAEGITFTPENIEQLSGKTMIGKTYSDEKEIHISATKNNSLWKVGITPSKTMKDEEKQQKNWVINVQQNGKTTSLRILTEEQIAGPLYQ